MKMILTLSHYVFVFTIWYTSKLSRSQTYNFSSHLITLSRKNAKTSTQCNLLSTFSRIFTYMFRLIAYIKMN